MPIHVYRADVVTDAPARYAKQLVAHLGRKIPFTTDGKHRIDGVASAPITLPTAYERPRRSLNRATQRPCRCGATSAPTGGRSQPVGRTEQSFLSRHRQAVYVYPRSAVFWTVRGDGCPDNVQVELSPCGESLLFFAYRAHRRRCVAVSTNAR